MKTEKEIKEMLDDLYLGNKEDKERIKGLELNIGCRQQRIEALEWALITTPVPKCEAPFLSPKNKEVIDGCGIKPGHTVTDDDHYSKHVKLGPPVPKPKCNCNEEDEDEEL